MDAEVLRMGIVGCGFIASEVHAPALVESVGVTVVAAADSNAERVGAYAKRFGLNSSEAFDSLETMLDSANVDAILISAPPGSHRRLAEVALGAGKHVMVEKPMALSAQDCQAMLDAAQATGRHLGVVCNFRHFPEMRVLSDLVSQKALGEPIAMRISSWGLGMDVAQILEFAGGSSDWKYNTSAAGGGVLMDYGVHCAYVVEQILGEKVSSVFCRASQRDSRHGNVEDQAVVLARYGETDVVLDLSWLPEQLTSSRNLQRGSLEILGTEGRAWIEYVEPAEAPHSVARAVHVHRGEAHEVVVLADVTRRERLVDSFAASFSEFAHFARMAPTNADVAHLAFRALSLVKSAYVSARTGVSQAITHDGVSRDQALGLPR